MWAQIYFSNLFCIDRTHLVQVPFLFHSPQCLFQHDRNLILCSGASQKGVILEKTLKQQNGSWWISISIFQTKFLEAFCMLLRDPPGIKLHYLSNSTPSLVFPGITCHVNISSLCHDLLLGGPNKDLCCLQPSSSQLTTASFPVLRLQCLDSFWNLFKFKI